MANRIGIRGRTVDLYVQVLDPSDGFPTNADSMPIVNIFDSYGNQQYSFGYNIRIADEGLYHLQYTIPLDSPDGYWSDQWNITVGGVESTATFAFLVLGPAEIEQAEPPVFIPSDNFMFHFTECEAKGISRIMYILKLRLKNNALAKIPNGSGGYTEVPCPVFADDELIGFIVNSLSEFNSTPHFTNYNFCDPLIIDTFLDILVQGAELLALSSQAIIERGKEYTITDNGITFSPPQLGQMLLDQFNAKLAAYRDKLKFIKASIKPSPAGLGTFRITAINPQITRLRHLRERQIF